MTTCPEFPETSWRQILEFRVWLRQAMAADPEWASHYARMIELVDQLERGVNGERGLIVGAPRPVVYLDEAVERLMVARGCSRRQANKILLAALKSGELTAYVDLNEPAKH